MGKVIARIHPRGIMSTPSHIAEREISNDFPTDIIGECVTEAMQAETEYNPTSYDYVIVIVFE